MMLNEWDRQLLGLTRKQYAAIRRRRALRTALDIAAEVAAWLLVAAFLWAFLALTPDQTNGDGEAVEVETIR